MTDRLTKISDVVYELPRTGQMNVPARIFASPALLEGIKTDRSLDQITNVAALPGIVEAAFLMPDAHEGYGFPIGGTAATLYPDGAISPGGIGYDVNCGVRLLTSSITRKDLTPYLDRLSDGLFRSIPSGTGTGGKLELDIHQMDQVLSRGAEKIVDLGYGTQEDLSHTESGGHLHQANPAKITDNAKRRGRDQVGTLGSGNHFCEVDVVEEIFDQKTAQIFNLHLDGIVVMIHTGSRGLGHQTATDYIRVFLSNQEKYGYSIPDKELASAPFSSPEGQDYFSAMSAAANFAWSNRQMITALVRKTWKWYLGGHGGELKQLYDVAHNMAKVEDHLVNNRAQKLIVHRKGATRAFPPGHPELPSLFSSTGQPVIIPGSMGTSSFVLAGQPGGSISFFTTCHGAGREMSRHEALRTVQGKALIKDLLSQGIIVRSGSIRGAAEEAPIAYKNVDDVVDVVHTAGIAKKVARLKPLIAIKG